MLQKTTRKIRINQLLIKQLFSGQKLCPNGSAPFKRDLRKIGPRLDTETIVNLGNLALRKLGHGRRRISNHRAHIRQCAAVLFKCNAECLVPVGS
jgi:hypothetical protein